MTANQRSTYNAVAEALRRHFGSVFQAEVYREQLKGRIRQQEEMVTVLSRDAFIDALEDQQVQIYVKQVHPADVQQTLARAMEFEAFLYTTTAAVTPHHSFAAQKPPRRYLPARRTQVQQERRRHTSSAAVGYVFCVIPRHSEDLETLSRLGMRGARTSGRPEVKEFSSQAGEKLERSLSS
ncbi:hypothetical protein E2C01_021398 [Portunus trituberculatus]|uniref:Uncharacterized protein n=1 Tax=Portunus trituberculatus TaxID=210409 RepID=A0A5B7E2I0_PORTR|nr:hypothetical protein [Portunus trituberculatus]